ncbi:hypothetical protein PHLGIDRAFT_223888 [Phlebiopsis gigantea 11061_1 CR5-6]|uniref:Uncharacterized protein n=1 Tax=Phlebiopsis gigantea (strain 11061_1 CR5-6) TaxID=745531 RepID=A0A0C3RT80_PHLG1|nr:hypothetical protein PHLGIDRAFT_223888 [Phlebiopsis gigantea 11061_1 CR5-6]
MSRITFEPTNAPYENTSQALWWRDFFRNHPGHEQRAPEAFSGIGGKAKVFCKRCLAAKIEEATFAERSAAVLAFTTDAEDAGFRGQEDIVREVLQSLSPHWIACRKTTCLGHLKNCRNQCEEIRTAAKQELDAENALRRVRRAKNKPAVPISLPSASANVPTLGPPIIDNAAARNSSLVLDGSGAYKVSYSRANTVPSGEALHMPHPTAAANDSPTTFSNHHHPIIPDVAFEWARNMAFQILAAGGLGGCGGIPYPMFPYADCNLPHGNRLPSASAFNSSYARTTTGLVPFDPTTSSSESYLRSFPETCTPYSMPMAFTPSWLPHTSGAGSPTDHMETYAHSGSDDMLLADIFGDLGIAPVEQRAYSYGSKEPTPPPSFETRTNTSSYVGSYDPFFACFD